MGDPLLHALRHPLKGQPVLTSRNGGTQARPTWRQVWERFRLYNNTFPIRAGERHPSPCPQWVKLRMAGGKAGGTNPLFGREWPWSKA